MELDQEKYFHQLFDKYPSAQAICREIIDLNLILNKQKKDIEYFKKEDCRYD